MSNELLQGQQLQLPWHKNPLTVYEMPVPWINLRADNFV